MTKEQEEGIEFDAAKHNMDVDAYKEWRLSQYGDMGYQAKQQADLLTKMDYVKGIPIEVLQPLYEGILAQKEALKVAEAMKAQEEAPKEK